MNIMARWSIVAGMLGMLVVGFACGGTNTPSPPQELGGSGSPETDAGVVDDDTADPTDKAPSIVDNEDTQTDPTDPSEPGETTDPSDVDPPPELSECAACVEANCQDERSECLTDETCTCWADCSESGGLSECIKDCEAPNQTTLAYHQCRDRNCLSECSPKFEPELPDGDIFPDGGLGEFDGSFPSIDAGNQDARSCDECVADSCSTQGAACEGNADCACWANCFSGNNWVECTDQCGSGAQGWFDLLGCRMSSCPQCN